VSILKRAAHIGAPLQTDAVHHEAVGADLRVRPNTGAHIGAPLQTDAVHLEAVGVDLCARPDSQNICLLAKYEYNK